MAASTKEVVLRFVGGVPHETGTPSGVRFEGLVLWVAGKPMAARDMNGDGVVTAVWCRIASTRLEDRTRTALRTVCWDLHIPLHEEGEKEEYDDTCTCFPRDDPEDHRLGER